MDRETDVMKRIVAFAVAQMLEKEKRGGLNNSGGTVTRLWRNRCSIPDIGKGFSLLQSLQTDSGYGYTYSLGNRAFLSVGKAAGT
jgi:hypothetical protein